MYVPNPVYSVAIRSIENSHLTESFCSIFAETVAIYVTSELSTDIVVHLYNDTA